MANYLLKTVTLLLLASIHTIFVASEIIDNTLDQVSCDTFNKRPYDCRYRNCQYNCDKKTCQDRVESDSRACESYCFDPCGCREAGCYYNTADHTCSEGVETITERNRFLFFDKGYDCYSSHAYYSKAGKLAEIKTQGPPECILQWGLNFNGDDEELFEGDYMIRESDPYGTRVFGYQDISDVTVDPESTHPPLIFETLIIGVENNRLPDRCATYYIPLDNVKKLYSEFTDLLGFYDACIKTTEHIYESAGQRRFNVRFNNKYVIHELDVFSLAQQRNKPIDVCWGFKLSANGAEMAIHGYPDWIPILNETIPLSFCYSRCYFVPDAGYVAAAFYIRKG